MAAAGANGGGVNIGPARSTPLDRSFHRGPREALEGVLRRDALAKRERAEAEEARSSKRVGCRSSQLCEGRGHGGRRYGGEPVVEGTLRALRLPKAAAERAPGGDDARNEEYAPRLEAKRVRDAEGRIVGDDGDHFADHGVRDAMEALSVEDYRHMMARRVREHLLLSRAS